MGIESKEAQPAPRRSRLLLHGESAVASAGIALAAILLSVMAASAWWAMRTQRAAAETARVEQVRSAGELLSQSAEALLAQDELSAVRRMVAEVGRTHSLSQCRVVLSDGQVIAAADPSQITLHKLPQTWSRERIPEEAIATTSGSIQLSYPLTIGTRGTADLEISATVVLPLFTYWDTQAGVGGIGAAALVALLVVYRRMRSRLRAIGAVREALLAIGEGAAPSADLAVSAELGPEARAWNEMIARTEQLRKQQVAERAGASLGRRGQAKSDLTAACDAMSSGLILVDEKNRISYANGAAAAFLKAKFEGLIGQDVSQVLHVEGVLTAIGQVSGGAGKRRTVIDVESQDDAGAAAGAGVLRFTVRPVRREDSASAMVTIEDITQQRAAEQARHAFVAQATHELRTPLTNIRLYVETAIEDGEQDPATRAKCLNVINGETRRLERIVGEMLSVAEIEAGSFKLNRDDVRLETVFEDLEADYRQQAQEKQIALSFALPPKLPVIQGDRDKMLMALHNLIGNALKYTPSGGKVTVEVEAGAKQLTVAVTDTGIGISPQDAEKIFERFYRASDPRVAKITGTGLGLTLAREVIRLHGGDISVDSKIDHGSTFTLTLPVTAQAAA